MWSTRVIMSTCIVDSRAAPPRWRLLGWIAHTAFASVVCTAASATDNALYERTGSSASIAGRAPVYATDAFHFSDVDGDGEEEFISIETTESYPKENIATVSRWLTDGGRLVEWRTGPLHSRRKLLVGNVDDDPQDEIVLFGEGYRAQPGEPTLVVADWAGSTYEITSSVDFSGRVGALVDVDGDGVNEIVLARIRENIRESEGTDPATLVVCRALDEGFELVSERDLAFGVVALVGGDVDGDGFDEIVSIEKSRGGSVRGQLSIYRVDTDSAIKSTFRKNRLVNSAGFVRVFESGGDHYLFVEGSLGVWKAVFRITALATGYDLLPESADQLDVFRDALSSTLAFSVERGALVRYVDRRMLEFIPVESP